MKKTSKLLKISKKRRIFSVLLLALLFGGLGYTVHTEGVQPTYLFICLLLVVGCLLIQVLNFRMNPYVSAFYMACVPFICFCLLESFTHIPTNMSAPLVFLNLVLYYLLFIFVFSLTGSSKAAILIECILSFIVGIANYYTVSFRSSPILPWDLNSIGVAATVTDNYSFTVPYEVLIIILLFTIVGVTGFKTELRLKNWKLRGGLAVLFLSLVLVYIPGVQSKTAKEAFGIDDTLFTPNYIYKANGFAVSFIYNFQFIQVSEPVDYSGDSVQVIEESMAEIAEVEIPVTTQSYTEKKPNIIVIMNEAFSDLSVLADYTTNKEVMPFINSLSENTIKGDLYVSVLGGNTANSEFEFLTGDSLAFLPAGSVAYQQFVKDETPTLVEQLKLQGYQTAAIHPYYRSGWDRDEVYEYFGFDDTYFIQDFNNPEMIRKYVSDREAFNKILELLEDKEEGQPFFAFEVTMQNHGGYSKTYPDFTPDIKVEEIGDQPMTESYLSLINKTDEAFEELVNAVSGMDEDTIIVMFGDHQPSDYVASPLLELNPDRGNTLEENSKRYVVPVIIWANYDIEEKIVDKLSVNYLSSLLMDVAGLPKSGYQSYLSQLSETLPVITGNVMIDKDGNYYSIDDHPYEKEMNEYSILQYNHLFDVENRSDDFFLKP